MAPDANGNCALPSPTSTTSALPPPPTPTLTLTPAYTSPATHALDLGDKIYLFDLAGELVSAMEVFEDGRAELDLPELHRRKSKAYASVSHDHQNYHHRTATNNAPATTNPPATTMIVPVYQGPGHDAGFSELVQSSSDTALAYDVLVGYLGLPCHGPYGSCALMHMRGTCKI